MDVPLDEGVPEPLSVILEPTHTFRHVNDLGWMGITDPVLFERAAAASFEVIVALDGRCESSQAWPSRCREHLTIA